MPELTQRDSYIDITAGTVFVRTWSSREISDTAPIILLHDSLGCVDLWKEFPEVLATSLHQKVIAYDRVGYGQSSARHEGVLPVDFMREEADTFNLIRQQMGIERYALFGHSTGGSIAIEIAAKDPEGCIAVVTESAHSFVESHTLDGVRAAKVRFSNPEKFERLKKQHGDKAEWVLNIWINTWLSSRFLDWSLAEALPRIKCPVLAFHCVDDKYGTPAHAHAIAAASGGEAIVLKGCGHIPHKNWEQEVIEAIRSILG